LLPGECAIWIVRLPELAAHEAAVDAVLTSTERTYVNRRRGPQATARLSRGLLRLLLADLLDVAPSEVEIDRTCPECGQPHGKPRLGRRPGAAPPSIEFSVSHGGDLLVLAFAVDTVVGVDVEPIVAAGNIGKDVSEELWDFTLTPMERERVREIPAHQRRLTFLRHWTGKEAALKALGTGLAVDPQLVTLPPLVVDGPASVARPDAPPAGLWLSGVDVGAQHVCTLATGHRTRLRSSPVSSAFLLDRLGQ
jgi:4'-phosphopantetheinyl transferase